MPAPGGFNPYQSAQSQPQYQAPNPYGIPQAPQGSGALAPSDIDSYSFEVLTNIDTMANTYVEQAQQTLNKLITSKIELSRTKNALEDELDSLKDRSAVAEQAVNTLQRENARLEKVVAEAGSGPVELNEANLDTMVFPRDSFSAKYACFIEF